eukprot:SAG31_NODE_28235_length_413_cov_0.990446_1_plen_56_part_10
MVRALESPLLHSGIDADPAPKKPAVMLPPPWLHVLRPKKKAVTMVAVPVHYPKLLV